MTYLELMQKNKPYAVVYSDMPTELQEKASQLCFQYNQTDPTRKDERQAVLSKLFHEPTKAGINSPFHCDYGFNVNFTDFAFLNYNVSILDTSPVNIGSGTMIGPNTCLACSGHSINVEQRKQGVMTSSPINIGNHVWIGANVAIQDGVTIGDNSVIGTGSVVTKDIPANVVALGSPCHVHRKINESDKVDIDKL